MYSEKLRCYEVSWKNPAFPLIQNTDHVYEHTVSEEKAAESFIRLIRPLYGFEPVIVSVKEITEGGRIRTCGRSIVKERIARILRNFGRRS